MGARDLLDGAMFSGPLKVSDFERSPVNMRFVNDTVWGASSFLWSVFGGPFFRPIPRYTLYNTRIIFSLEEVRN